MSIRSTVRRTAASLAIGALATTGLVAVASAPAHAATEGTVSTLKMETSGGSTTGEFGAYLSSTGSVKSTTSGGSPYAGSAYLQRQLPGSSSWTNIATDTSAGFAYFPTVNRFTGNASYRLYYAGGSNGSTYNPITWAPSYSNVVKISTYRKVTASGRGRNGRIPIKVKVSPAAKVKVTVEVKVRGKWRKQINKKTNAKGRLNGVIRGRTGTKVRVTAKGNAQFVRTRWTAKII